MESNTAWGGRVEEARVVWDGGWGSGMVMCWHKLRSLVWILSAHFPSHCHAAEGIWEPIPFPPIIMPQFPCVQLLLTISKPLLLLFFINKALFLFRMATLPVEIPPSLSWCHGGQITQSWPMRLETKVLGSDFWRSLQKWTDLADFLFCLLAFLLSSSLEHGWHAVFW